jgi:hypothetical protein
MQAVINAVSNSNLKRPDVNRTLMYSIVVKGAHSSDDVVSEYQ